MFMLLNYNNFYSAHLLKKKRISLQLVTTKKQGDLKQLKWLVFAVHLALPKQNNSSFEF